MRVIYDGFWLRRGYDALTFFGTIVAASPEMAAAMESDEGKQLLNHEMIHLHQARDTHDSWLCFYLLYIWYYLRLLPFSFRQRNAAYILNPFELEAYRHMHDMGYLDRSDCGRLWRKYAKLTAEERLELWRMPFRRDSIL